MRSGSTPDGGTINLGLMPKAGRLFCTQNVWVRFPQTPLKNASLAEWFKALVLHTRDRRFDSYRRYKISSNSKSYFVILAHLVEQKFLGTLGSGFNSHKLQQLSSSKISLIFYFIGCE